MLRLAALGDVLQRRSSRADDVLDAKPSAEGASLALERLGRQRPIVHRSATLALEDGVAGIRAARAAGIRCVAVGPLAAHVAMEADAYVPSLDGQTMRSLDALSATGRGAGAMTNPHVAVPPRRAGSTEIGGQDVVLAYAGVNAEYEALRTHAIVVDRSHRGRMRFFGEKSGEALTGLVTNDVVGDARRARPVRRGAVGEGTHRRRPAHLRVAGLVSRRHAGARVAGLARRW